MTIDTMNLSRQTSDYMVKRSQKEKKYDHLDTEQLVEGCRAGDKHCERLLFKKYRETVFFVILHTLGPNFDKDDIFQQVFIKIFKSLNRFKGLSSLETWIYRITTKVCIDQLRKKYRKRQLQVIQNPEVLENRHDTTKSDPYEEREQKELTKQIYIGLEKLSIEKRLVVTMFEMEGFSLQDISKILKKPIGTIKSRLFHGRKELAWYLRNYMES
jgi:RNA polymerase sigma-70 factor (ECF subfamily)